MDSMTKQEERNLTVEAPRRRLGPVLVLLAGVALVGVGFAWPAQPRAEMSAAQAAVLGVVEGVTEYLPVSSTGHLILVSHAMGFSELGGRSGPFGPEVIKSPAVSAFEIVIQFGAILAVLGLYRRRVGQMARGLVGRDRQGLRLALRLLIAFLPAAVIGLMLHEPIGRYLFGPLTVCLALVVGGLLMIAVEWFLRRRKGPGQDVDSVAYWQALAIGLAQVLAMWPGTSRSMVTILAAMLVGLSRVSAAEFSFLLALPTLGAATVYEAASSAGDLMSVVGFGPLLVGVVVSALVAAVAVKLLVQWLNHHGLVPFGVYRILLGGSLLWYFSDSLL